MNPRRHAIVMGLARGRTEFLQSVRSTQDQGFYLFTALLVVGTVFALTACAYGVMTVRGLDPQEPNDLGLMGIMSRWGLTILLAELALLAVLTVLAIGTDDFWARRAAAGAADKPDSGKSDR